MRECVLFISFLLSLQLLDAQSNAYRFKRFNTEQGLSNPKVNTIVEDQAGFLWIGTNDGLNRFDGYGFNAFFHDLKDSTTISSNQITSLLADSKGQLWVGTHLGLNLYVQSTADFKRISLISEFGAFSKASIRDIKEDENGLLWLATNAGVFVLNRENKVEKHFIHDENDPNSLSDNSIGSILFDREGQVWIGALKHINLLNKTYQSFERFPLSRKFDLAKGPPVSSLYQDTKGRIWVASYFSGLNLFDPETRSLNYFPLKNIPEDDLLLHRIRAIHEDEEGELWLGTYAGIILLNPDNGTERKIVHDPKNDHSLSHSSVNCIFQDQRKNLWIGAFFGGLNYLDKNINAIKHYQYTGDQNGPSFNVISSIEEDEKGHIWIAVERDGLNRFDPVSQTFEYYKPNQSDQSYAAQNHIKEIALGHHNKLWIGTLFGGLFSFDLNTKQFSEVSLSDKDHPDLSVFRIRSLEVDHLGNLWVVSNAGLHYYDTKTGKVIPSEISSLLEELNYSVSYIFEDQQHNIWGTISNKNGIFRFDADTKELVTYDIPQVLCIFQETEDNFWLGTRKKGFYSLDVASGHIQRYSLEEVSDDEIFGILTDDRGHLWISCRKGILKFDKRRETHRLFQEDDGLKGQQFKRDAFFRSSTNELYFGGNKGFCVFDPNHLGDESFAPPVVLTNFQSISSQKGTTISNSQLKAPQTKDVLELPWHQNTLFIDFVAINYSRPDKTQYAYRLEGFDDWNYIGNRRNATYTNLDPGPYTFQVQATNGDGVWIAKSEKLQLYISPPPWRSWWAYSLYVLGILMLALFIQQTISNRIRFKNKLKLEQFKREQTQSFHELKYRFFTNISHDLKTPLTLLLGPVEKLLTYYSNDVQVRRQLNVAYKNGERLLHLINQLMDFRRLETNHIQLRAAKGNFARFCHEIYLSFLEEARYRGIDFHFEAREEDIELYFDRDKIEKVLYNLLSNAFKFTPDGGSIRFTISLGDNGQDSQKWKEGYVELKIEDNGIGMTESCLKNLFNPYADSGIETYNQEASSGIGLSIVKGLTDLHKGTIEVESQYGEGTTFILRLPHGKNHLKKNQILDDFKNSDAAIHYRKPGALLPFTFDAVPLLVNENSASVANKEKQPLLLIVEDNPDIQQYIIDIFQADYRLLLAGNGKEGFTKAINNNPDLIISDIMMPKMNGIDLCSQLKQELKTSHIPVILLSARTALIFKVNGLETGADDYISKPFSPQLLQLKVKNLLLTHEKLKERFRNEANLNLQSIAVTSADERFLENLIQVIEKNMKNPAFGVEFLGNELRMTRVHLYRKIKALTNMTASEFVRTIRLRYAAKLLTTTFLNINEVSYEIGFQDPSYFRKCFKQMFEVSPSKYRDKPKTSLNNE